MKVSVIYNSFSPSKVEAVDQIADDDTEDSAVQVSAALKGLGYEVDLLEVLPDKIADIANISADVIFNLCEWSGHDFPLGVEVIKTLEASGKIFTGGSSDNYLWSSKKELMKKLFDDNNLPTPGWFLYEQKGAIPNDFVFPAIVKPAWEHCAIGLDQHSVVSDQTALEKQLKTMSSKYQEPLIVEEFLEGDEYQVTVLEKEGHPWVLAPAEIVYSQLGGLLPMLTFNGKWLEGAPEGEISELRIFSRGPSLKKEIETIAANAFIRLACRDFVRIDMRESQGKVFILEVNVNPGLDWDMDYSMTLSAQNEGLNFKNLVNAIVQSALLRHDKVANSSIPSSGRTLLL